MKPTAFEQAARAHADSRAAIGTRYLYNADLNHWLKFCRRNKYDPAKPKTAQATAFRDEFGSTRAPQTVRRTLAALSSMYQSAVEQEKPLASWNPFRRLPRPSADAYVRTEALTAVEANAIIAACIGWTAVRDTAILTLLYETGLRRSSVAALEREDVLSREGRTVLRVIVKGGKRREVEVPDRAAVALKAWIATCEPSRFVFAGYNGKAMHPTCVNRIVKARSEQAGVVHAHPHRFRATFVTESLNAGIPLHEVQASVHHSSSDTTQRYDRGERGKGVTDTLAEFRRRSATGGV